MGDTSWWFLEYSLPTAGLSSVSAHAPRVWHSFGVQVSDHLTCELHDGDDASSDAEQIHFVKASGAYGDRSCASVSNVV